MKKKPLFYSIIKSLFCDMNPPNYRRVSNEFFIQNKNHITCILVYIVSMNKDKLFREANKKRIKKIWEPVERRT